MLNLWAYIAVAIKNGMKDRPDSHISCGRKWLVAVELCIATTAICIALLVFRRCDAWSVVCSFAVAYLVPRFLMVRCGGASALSRVALMLSAILVMTYAMRYIWNVSSPEGYSTASPLLQFDDNKIFAWALSNYNGEDFNRKLNFPGLSIVTLGLWKMLGVSIVWPVAMNVMLTLVSVVVTGATASRLIATERFSREAICGIAMFLTSLLCFYLSQGGLLLKEALCYAAMAIAAYGLAGMSNGWSTRSSMLRDSAFIVFGAFLMAFARTSFAYFIAIGCVVCGARHWRNHWKAAALLTLVCIAITLSLSMAYFYSFAQQYRTVAGEGAMPNIYIAGSNQQPFKMMVGDYFHCPVWKRVLLLPLTVAVQGAIPFPWVYDVEHLTFYSLLPRIQWGWYAVGGIAFFHYFFLSFRKGDTLHLWAWWPVAVFLIIAYITGGSVSRYSLSTQPLYAIVATSVVVRAVEARAVCRRLMWWLAAFVAFMAVALTTCHKTQVRYLDNLEQTYRERARKHREKQARQHNNAEKADNYSQHQ